MLAFSAVKEVESLLKQGFSQREIASIAEVSRGSVGRIAKNLKTCNFKNGKVVSLPIKCPTCRCLVYPPCIACHTRKYIANKRKIEENGSS